METSLETQSFPVTIASGFIKDEQTSLVMQCHDRTFQNVTLLDTSGETIFTVESKGAASWSWRRTVKDASGTPVFELRKIYGYVVRNRWTVESRSGNEVCSLRHGSFKQHQALNAVVRNEDDKGNEVVVEVRPKDQGAVTTLVFIGEAPVAEIQMAEVNPSLRERDRSVWRARVAGGVDLALIMAIMLCRAEMEHVWGH